MTCGDVSSCSTSNAVDIAGLLVLDDLERRCRRRNCVSHCRLRASSKIIAAQANDEVLADALLDIGFQVAAILLEFLLAEEGAAGPGPACDS